MSDPLVPNYKKDVGRLATDRYDFEGHIEGSKFRHQAGQTDLFPTVVVGSTQTNVQDAIEALAAAVTPPVIADATTLTKGIIQLTGDISGFANNVLVTRLQGFPVSNLSPNNGDVLTWNNTLNIWNPATAINSFTAAGDLSGNNILQNVISLTGAGGTVRILCNNIGFSSNTTPVISEDNNTLSSGNDFVIRAQSSTAVSQNGGTLILAGGVAGSGGLRGGALIQLANANSNMLELTELSSGRRVLSLFRDGYTTVSDMPTNTGDMVMYVRNAATAPTTGTPTNGVIVYASSGQLWVKQSDGNNFSVGSLPNPSILGATGQQIYTQRNYVTSTSASPQLAISFNLPDNTATKVEVTFVGKKLGTADSAQFNMNLGYVRDGGGAPVAVGSLTNPDSRTTAAASSWITPTISVSGNVLQIFTGANAATTINWLVVAKLTMSLA